MQHYGERETRYPALL